MEKKVPVQVNIKGMTTKDNEGFIRAAKDITAGCAGGIAQVLTGQPFDIVKVSPCREGNTDDRSDYKLSHHRDQGNIRVQ
jgi:hypothetical protein